ncbi:FAD-binding protein [Aestuariicella hydrocarbonica]|uniref:FAD-binding protein n=1 Tax=Pseudomaricurvus hydrocarbonicus TaxID=1470433 RepID=A0A9E5JT81_9GAMM|nr:FAD-binding protein [Aestuariicella hydrocarbonica]NHO66104.1 FAD-binding protein [Aestuariicella hydrocarbonica]
MNNEQRPSSRWRQQLQTAVAPPRVVNTAGECQWHGETQVAVVGYGAAGASAALQAAEDGARVTVLDRLNGGGASALSGGVVYAGGGTRFQQQAGEQDSVENMLNYLRQETAGVVSEETLRRFCEHSVENIDWLQAHGVPFSGTAYNDKASYPPEGYFLYYSGNETCMPYRQQATPAKRGHRTAGEDFTGRVLFASLHRSASMHEHIDIQPHCEVQRLIVDRDHRLLGVEYLQAPTQPLVRCLMALTNRFANRFALFSPQLGGLIRRLVHLMRRCGQVRCLRVTQGIILSTGGFVFNRPLLAQVAPDYTVPLPLGEECNGSGIGLGVSAGGAVAHLERISAWRFFSPPADMLKGMVVDKTGQRICNEDLYGATTADKVMATEGKRAYLIMDQTLIDQCKRAARPGKLPWHAWLPARLFLNASSVKAQSPAALAEACGFDADDLQRSLETYNAGVHSGEDQFGKAGKYMQPLDQGPFYAIDISISNTRVPCHAITLGGLRVNEGTGEVLNDRGEPISGLYAAGRTAVGICSNSYLSGLSLADCVFSGRRAGVHAATRNTSGSKQQTETPEASLAS